MISHEKTRALFDKYKGQYANVAFSGNESVEGKVLECTDEFATLESGDGMIYVFYSQMVSVEFTEGK